MTAEEHFQIERAKRAGRVDVEYATSMAEAAQSFALATGVTVFRIGSKAKPPALADLSGVTTKVCALLKQAGPLSTTAISAALGWQKKNAAARLASLVATGKVLRAGKTANGGRGGKPVTLWALPSHRRGAA